LTCAKARPPSGRQKSYPIGEEMSADSLSTCSNLARFAELHWRWDRMQANYKPIAGKKSHDGSSARSRARIIWLGQQYFQNARVTQRLKENATMATQTLTKQNQTVEDKIQQLRQLYADAPEFAKTALENTLKDLASTAAQPRSRMESAGRTGVRQGTVSELTVIAPFAPGGAARLRALLQLRNGNFDDTDRVGTVHDMRFVFLDNDTKLLFATAYDGDWDVYIEDFVAKIPNEMDVLFSCFEGWRRHTTRR
jgi:hypothetical protein